MNDSARWDGQRRWGAYGLHLTGLETVGPSLVEAPATWPNVSVERVLAPGATRPDTLTDDRAEYSITGCPGSVRIDRSPLRVRFAAPAGLSDDEIIHPGLAGVASIVNRWLDRDAFHAGAFLVGSGAWAVLGAKEAGKSSTLGYVAAKGIGVVSDDVLVVEDGRALAGPRFVDLRAEAAEWMGQGIDIGVVGIRRRWRMHTSSVPAEAPLRGWIVPEWGERIEIGTVPPLARLPLLCANLGLVLPPRDAVRLLRLASLPFLVFRRPRRWDAMHEAMDALCDHLDV